MQEGRVIFIYIPVLYLQEGRVIFNDETQEFEVIMGENVRMPQPVVTPTIVEPAQKNNMADGMLRADPVKPLKHVPSSHDEL